MEHPKYADKNIVALVHKRMVMHPHTTTNVMVADVFKATPFCIFECTVELLSMSLPPNRWDFV